MEKMALLLIDLQKDFFEDSSGSSKENKKILPNIIKLLRECRNKKIPIIHIRWILFETIDKMPLRRKECKITRWCRTEKGCEPVVPELDVAKGEQLIKKQTYSGFFNTPLDSLLKENDISTLIMVGIYSSMCVFATALDATYRDYKVIIPKECVISSRSEFNNEYLKNMDDNIAEVLNLEKLLEII
jgi:maleamate amidohydrolase